MRKIVLALAIASLSLSGCAAQRALVAGYLEESAASIPPAASFQVVPNKEVPNAVFDARVKRKIEDKLRERGFAVQEAGAGYTAQYGYSIEGRTEVTVAPVFGNLAYNRHYVRGYHAFPGDPADMNYSAFGAAVDTFYSARLWLKVLKGETAVWFGEALIETDKRDLAQVIDGLIAAAFKFFGQDTGKAMEVALRAEELAPAASAAK